jgi:hypothetical protein
MGGLSGLEPPESIRTPFEAAGRNDASFAVAQEPTSGRGATSRSARPGEAHLPPGTLTRPNPHNHSPDWYSNPSSMSYPSAVASFGAAATMQGRPTIGVMPTSTSTISAAVAPAFTAASA